MAKVLLDEKGVRVEIDPSSLGVDIENVYLRKVDLFRRYYVIEISTYAKYPALDGYSTSEDNAHEVYVGANDRTLFYSGDGEKEMDGIPGLSALLIRLPKKRTLPRWLTRRDKWNMPRWHIAGNAFADKYSIEVIAWYGSY